MRYYKPTCLASPLPVRFLGAVSINYIVAGGEMPSNKSPLSLGNVLVRSIKYWADVSMQGLTAAVNEPCINNLNPKGDPRGTLNYAPDKLQDLMAGWLKRGWQLIVHANGDRATDQVFDSRLLDIKPLSNGHPRARAVEGSKRGLVRRLAKGRIHGRLDDGIVHESQLLNGLTRQ